MAAQEAGRDRRGLTVLSVAWPSLGTTRSGVDNMFWVVITREIGTGPSPVDGCLGPRR